METIKNTLPALVAETRNQIAIILENEGAIPPEMDMALAQVESMLPVKLDSYAYLIEGLDNEAKYFASKAEQFEKIAKACKGTQDFLKNRIKQAAVDLQTSEFRGNDFKFVISNSKPSVIVDETLIDGVYYKEEVIRKIDTKKIEEDLKMGVPVVGASFRENKALRISANKKVGAK